MCRVHAYDDHLLWSFGARRLQPVARNDRNSDQADSPAVAARREVLYHKARQKFVLSFFSSPLILLVIYFFRSLSSEEVDVQPLVPAIFYYLNFDRLPSFQYYVFVEPSLLCLVQLTDWQISTVFDFKFINAFFAMQLIGCVGCLAVLLTGWLSPIVHRHSTWYNLLISWTLSSVYYSLLWVPLLSARCIVFI